MDAPSITQLGASLQQATRVAAERPYHSIRPTTMSMSLSSAATSGEKRVRSPSPPRAVHDQEPPHGAKRARGVRADDAVCNRPKPAPAQTRDEPGSEAKRTKADKAAHAAARQAAWMEANGVTSVPDVPLPQSASPLDFGSGLFLAPMVRSGTVINRLLALQHGADLVWTPEVVDRAVISAERIVDERTSLVSYIKPNEASSTEDDKLVWSTHPIEQSRLIFQLGTASPAMAYCAIKKVTDCGDVAGVDLNCGCPKPFSTLGGMGSNLLTQPELLCDILRAMRKAAPAHVSVTCKIRLLPSQADTLALVRRIVESNTVDAITVHCRTKEMRPREPALPARLPEVVAAVRDASGGRVPVVLNGDAWDRAEAERLMAQTGVGSAMIARGAEANPSAFAPQAQSVRDVVWPQAVRYALWLQNPVGNTKWVLAATKLRPRLRRADDDASKSARSEPVFSLPYAEEVPLAKAGASHLAQTLAKCKTYEDFARLGGIDEDLAAFLARPQEDVLGSLRDTLSRKPAHHRMPSAPTLAPSPAAPNTPDTRPTPPRPAGPP